MPIAVAIDGPAGAGKSTIAKQVAGKVGALYLDTGAMYRAVGLHMVRHGIVPGDAEAVRAELGNVRIDVRYHEGSQRLYLGGEDVTGSLRTPEIDLAASAVSAIGEVREAMVAMQRQIALGADIVMDGRDIGTHVLPDAQVKIYLTADAEERARRRVLENTQKGIECDPEQILAEIKQRDIQDSTRAVSPLRQAGDAVVLDSTHRTIEECVRFVLDLIEQKRKETENA